MELIGFEGLQFAGFVYRYCTRDIPSVSVLGLLIGGFRAWDVISRITRASDE